MLNNQHTQQITLVNNGGAHKAVKTLFSQPGYQLETRVGTRIFKVEHFPTGGYPAHQTLASSQRKRANFVGIEAFSGAENQSRRRSVRQVYRAHIGCHGPANLMDNE